MRFRTKVFTLLLVVAVLTAALIAAFVPGGCRGFLALARYVSEDALK